MTFKLKRAFLSVLLLHLGFVLGCGKSEGNLKVDPELANKPFPKADGRRTP